MKKHLNSILVTGFAAAIMFFGSSTAQADLLANAGFEDPLAAPDLNLDTNWSSFAGGAAAAPAQPILDTVNPLGGLSHLSVTFAGEGNGFAGIQQSEDGIVTGQDYTFTMSALFTGSNLGVNAEFRIEWLDAGGNFIGGQFDTNVDVTDALTNNYQEFSLTAAAPTGATQLRAVIALQSFGTGQAGSTDDFGTVFVDNADVTTVPEPTTFGLVALGMVGLVARRRR